MWEAELHAFKGPGPEDQGGSVIRDRQKLFVYPPFFFFPFPALHRIRVPVFSITTNLQVQRDAYCISKPSRKQKSMRDFFIGTIGLSWRSATNPPQFFSRHLVPRRPNSARHSPSCTHARHIWPRRKRNSMNSESPSLRGPTRSRGSMQGHSGIMSSHLSYEEGSESQDFRKEW